jgi:hypothetical protein
MEESLDLGGANDDLEDVRITSLHHLRSRAMASISTPLSRTRQFGDGGSPDLRISELDGPVRTDVLEEESEEGGL